MTEVETLRAEVARLHQAIESQYYTLELISKAGIELELALLGILKRNGMSSEEISRELADILANRSSDGDPNLENIFANVVTHLIKSAGGDVIPAGRC